MKRSKVLLPVLLSVLAAFPVMAAPARGTVAVFVPGAVAGSPIYEQLVSGASRAVKETPGASVKVVEGGFNQAEWPEKMKGLAASGAFDWIVTSNPSMPEICAEAAKLFPSQKFICLDGDLSGNPSIHSSWYDQKEQGYLVGYLAALITAESGKGDKFGAVVAQRYPALDGQILPGFLAGAKAVIPSAVIDVRVVGNWFDANKGAELANALFDSGVKVILPVAGGAGQGVISAAKTRNAKIVWLDSAAYSLAPRTIIGCAILSQDRLAYERVKAALAGSLKTGVSVKLGMKDGWIDFADTAPEYIASVSASVRAKMDTVIKGLRSGTLVIKLP